MTKVNNFLFSENLAELDPQITRLIASEETRQIEKLLMIPSESLCPEPVREALATVFSNKYAEGYPSLRMSLYERAYVEEEFERYLAFHRRYGDRRFYKGAEYCNFIEVLAQVRAAKLFATKDIPPERIFVNVQPLSGAAANNAVYNAFLQPGDVIMGMALSYGGHLTHGSPFNRSGRQYRVIPYQVDMSTGRLDYAKIEQLAQEYKPKLIIAGASAYPWDIDWKKLAAIAQAVPVQIPGLYRSGAILLADIAHPAGLVIAGLFPNPIGFADVITLTTHKTLCGPRGAIILSTNEEIAKRIDAGVFPGEQGGPHLNNIAAKAVCFKLAASREFKELQKRIVENCQILARALQKYGFTLAYGGTNTHMLLIDLDKFPTKSGIPLKGDIASDILDLCGITCNKNALPGDETGARPRGIRLGTVILTQRGMGPVEMEKIAELIYLVLSNIQTFKVVGITGERIRGKIPLEVIEEVRKQVKQLLENFPIKTQRHLTLITNSMKTSFDSSRKLIEIIGERATTFLQEIIAADIYQLKIGEKFDTLLFDDKGKEIDKVTIYREKDTPTGYQHYLMAVHSNLDKVFTWLKGLSDGYILFDQEDIYRKIDGPVVIKQTTNSSPLIENILQSHQDNQKNTDAKFQICFTKPYFIGQSALLRNQNISTSEGEKNINNRQLTFTYTPYEGHPRQTCLYEEHCKLTKKIVPFAGWSMPLWYTRSSEEHRAVRTAAGLFDVSHMGRLRITGDYATRFLDIVTTNYVLKLRPGQAHYSYILDTYGNVMDDIFLYKLAENDYIIVCNAINAEKILQWLQAINLQKVPIDLDYPLKHIEGKVTITDLRPVRYSSQKTETFLPKSVDKLPSNKVLDSGQIVNIALQGPNSLKILGEVRLIETLPRSHIAEFTFEGLNLLIARTGYTGEEIGFEIMVEASEASKLWNLLLERGKKWGLLPCGLAARDSLRIEAGLPLYGHELAGSHNILPIEAGYGGFVKLHKPFFIGRDAYLKKLATVNRTIVRFQITSLGARAIKPNDPVVNRKGEYIGEVTSCTLVGNSQIGMAYIQKGYEKEGTRIAIYPLPRDDKKTILTPPEKFTYGDKVLLPEEAVVLSRFPLRKSQALSTPATST